MSPIRGRRVLGTAFALLIAVLVATEAQGRARSAATKPDTAWTTAERDTLRALRALVDRSAFAPADSGARALMTGVTARHGAESVQAAEVMVLRATVMAATGDLPHARAMHEQALAIRERVLGAEVPEVGASCAALGALLRRSGDPAAAVPVLQRALAIEEKTLGPENYLLTQPWTNLGGVFLDLGRYEESAHAYERALALREKALGPEHADVALTSSTLGMVYGHLGRNEDALRAMDRALAIQEKVFGPDHVSVAQTLSRQGAVHREMGDYPQALALDERALAIREKTLGLEHPDATISLYNVAVDHSVLGPYEQSRAEFTRLLAIREKLLGPDHPDVAQVLIGMGNTLADMSDYDEARVAYERALRILERASGRNEPAIGSCLTNLASVCRQVGEYTESRRLLDRADSILVALYGPEHREVARCVANVAALDLVLGDYEEALREERRALAICEKTLAPDHPEVTVALRAVANILERLGRHDESLGLLERSLAMRIRKFGPEHRWVGLNEMDIGRVLITMGRYAEARTRLERAFAIAEKRPGEVTLFSGWVREYLANLAIVEDDPRRAIELLRPVVEATVKRVGPDHPQLARTLGLLAIALLDGGRPDTARAVALQAERVGRDGVIVAAQGLPERQALAYAASRIGGMDVAITSLGTAGTGRAASQVLDAVIRSRAVVLDEMGSRHRALEASEDTLVGRLRERFERASARYAARLVRASERASPDDPQTSIEHARRERENAERALADVQVAFRRARGHARIGLAEVRRQLPTGAVLVSFVRYGRIGPIAAGSAADWRTGIPSYGAFIAGRGGSEPRWIPLGPAAAIDSLVTRWRIAASDSRAVSGSRDLERDYRFAGEALRREIWDSIQTRLGGPSEVFVVPDGALNLVSFATLPAGRDGYLVERRTRFHYLSHERDLVPPDPAPARGAGMLAVGGLDFDATPIADGTTPAAPPTSPDASRAPVTRAFRGGHAHCGDFASMRFTELPGTLAEIDEVARAWRTRRLGPAARLRDTLAVELTGAGGSEATFEERAPGWSVIHLATHGFFVNGECGAGASKAAESAAENPLLLAGLAFAGANRRDEAKADETDGVLTAEEIAALDLTSVDWAVLSACETGVGAVRPGEGVLGLRRAFQIAGARTLVMSLWPVGDEPTRQWMRRLYMARFQRGRSTIDAVRDASVGTILERRAAGRSTHPFFWGAFVAAGDWR